MSLTKSEIRTHIRSLLMRVTGRTTISGTNNLGDPAPLGMDLLKTKGLKGDINDFLAQYGPKPRITFVNLEKLYKGGKKVSDLEETVFQLAQENEKNATSTP